MTKHTFLLWGILELKLKKPWSGHEKGSYAINNVAFMRCTTSKHMERVNTERKTPNAEEDDRSLWYRYVSFRHESCPF
jgi:hypothetical protein